MDNPNVLVKTESNRKDSLETIAENLLRDECLRLQQKQADRGDPTVLDLLGEAVYSAAYTGVQAPVVGFAQIVDHSVGTKVENSLSIMPAPSQEEFGSARWHAQQIGGAAGIVLPFALTRSTMKASGLTLASKGELALASSGRLLSRANAAVVADGALSGFAMDFFLTPVQKDEPDFWRARLNNGLTGAATFGTLTAGSITLGRATRPFIGELTGARRMAADVVLGASSGAPAGVVSADVHSLLTKGTLATKLERAQSAYTMTMVGGVLSAAHRIPGQDGLLPLEYRQRQAAKSNLESMLAERARSVSPVDATTGGAKAEGAEARPASIKNGRELASGDVVTDGRVVAVDMKAELAPVLQKAIDEGMRASEPLATPAEVSQFIEFVRTEGAPVKQWLLKIAEESRDSRFLTIVQEASLPARGIELPALDYKIAPEAGKPVTPDQLKRWQKFVELVSESPRDTQGYTRFRHEVFDWLSNNPDLHSWVKQFHKNSNHSSFVGPLDYFFETNELSRFMNVPVSEVQPKQLPKRSEASHVEQSQGKMIPLDILHFRTHAREFAEKVLRAPNDADISRNFQELCYKASGLSVGQVADIINQVLREGGPHTTVEPKSNDGTTLPERYRPVTQLGLTALAEGNELTLYRHKTEQIRTSVGVLDCDALPRATGPVPKRDNALIYNIGTDLAKQLQYADSTARQQQIFAQTILKLRDIGVHPSEMAYELNYVFRDNNSPWTVVGKNNKVELLSSSMKNSRVPIISAKFTTGKRQ